MRRRAAAAPVVSASALDGGKGDVGGFEDGESGRIAVGDGRLGGGFEALVGWPFLVVSPPFFFVFFGGIRRGRV